MIEHRAYNVAGEKPQLQKVIVVTAGEEEYITVLVPENDDELAEVDEALIEEHMDNLLAYSKELANSMAFYPTMEEAGGHPFPITHMEDHMRLLDETCRWWSYLYHIDEYRGSSLVVSEEEHAGLHDADTPHIHHPDSGEIIYTDTAEAHTHDEATGDVVYDEGTTTEETPA